MRLAIIAAAHPSAGPLPSTGERDALLVADRLALPDLGFAVVELDPGTDAAEQLDGIFQDAEEDVQDVLFYASSAVAIGEGDECFLCLDASQPDVGDAVGDIAGVLGEHVDGPCLVIVDARYTADAGHEDSRMAEAVVAAMARSMTDQAPELELITAARPSGAHDERIPSRLTAGLLESLDTILGPLTALETFNHARENTDFGPWPNAALHVPGTRRFAFRPLAPDLEQAPEAEDADGLAASPPANEPEVESEPDSVEADSAAVAEATETNGEEPGGPEDEDVDVDVDVDAGQLEPGAEDSAEDGSSEESEIDEAEAPADADVEGDVEGLEPGAKDRPDEAADTAPQELAPSHAAETPATDSVDRGDERRDVGRAGRGDAHAQPDAAAVADETTADEQPGDSGLAPAEPDERVVRERQAEPAAAEPAAAEPAAERPWPDEVAEAEARHAPPSPTDDSDAEGQKSEVVADRFPNRRPAPPSERAEVASVSLSAVRAAKPARDPAALPKIIISAAAQPEPASSSASATGRAQPPPPPRHRRQRRSRRSSLRSHEVAPEVVRQAAIAAGWPIGTILTASEPEADHSAGAAAAPADATAAPPPDAVASGVAAEREASGVAHGQVPEQPTGHLPGPAVDEGKPAHDTGATTAAFEQSPSPDAAAQGAIETAQAEAGTSRRTTLTPGEMSVADWIAEAEQAEQQGQLDDAAGYYKKALGKLGMQTTVERGEIYVRLGEILHRQGKSRMAVSNFDKALAIIPADLRALRNLVEVNAELGNWSAVESAEVKWFGVLEREDLLRELVRSGDRWSSEGGKPKLARARYEAARDMFPDAAEPLERLLPIFASAKRTDDVIETRKLLLELRADLEERAEGYFDLGEWCLFEVHRPLEAHAAFERALECAPTRLEILEVLASSLAELQEWGELERIYRKMLELIEASPDCAAAKPVTAEIYHRLGLLLRDHLDDPERALECVESSLRRNARNLSGQLLAAELCEQLELPERALRHMGWAAEVDPKRNQTYRDVFDLAVRLGATDTAYMAAGVLVLGEQATDEERIVYHKHRPDPVPEHVDPLREEDWNLLRDTHREASVDAVMRAVGPTVLRLRVAQLEAEGKLPKLPDAARQSPETSTVSVVRSIGWASHFLGLPAPAIYLSDEAPGSLLAPFAAEPSVVAGRAVLRGRSLGELAFIVGRHVALRRPEHELVAHLRSVDELTVCFLAALELVLHSTADSGALGNAVRGLAVLLEQHQRDAEREELTAAVEAFERSGGRVKVSEWLGSVERCATRAGLLLCGDIATAAAVVRDESEPALLSVAERLDDLCVFSVSDEMRALREALGSTLPPDEG